jgi:hypothetical protein
VEMFARRLDDWMASTKDLGGEPEPESARAL